MSQMNYKTPSQLEELELVKMADEVGHKVTIQEKSEETQVVSTSYSGSLHSLWHLLIIELLGTFFLVLFGNASVACIVLTTDPDIKNDVNQLYWSIGYGMGLYFALLLSASISGGHLNPAVTISMLTLRKVNIVEALVYIIGQFLGAFLSAAVLYGLFVEQIKGWEDQKVLIGMESESSLNYTLATAGIFTTFPNNQVGMVTCFFDQFVGTGLLLFGILSITDSDNLNVSKSAQPAAISAVLTLILIAFGSNCGGALNPARDLSPRVFTALAGWGSAVFSVREYKYFWIPIVGPIMGALAGTWLYQLLVFIRKREKSNNNGIAG